MCADGGNVELVEIDGPVVYLRLQGACGSCPSSLTTMTMGIKRRLQERIPVRAPSLSLPHALAWKWRLSEGSSHLHRWVRLTIEKGMLYRAQRMGFASVWGLVEEMVSDVQEILEIEQLMDEDTGLELTEDNIEDVLDEIRPYLVGEDRYHRLDTLHSQYPSWPC